MFCPNCGTQNPDAAQTCSKCGFHLRGAAAPKFKGTMLMMNQPGATPPPPAAAPPPRPPGAAPMPSKLKGTMVGVAPPQPAQHPGQMPPPQAPPHGAPPGGESGLSDPAASFSPPGVQPGVNPLGGTVAADRSAFAPPHGGQGFAAPGSPYGAPPPQAPQYGGPPHPAPPQGAHGQNPPVFPHAQGGAQAPGGPMRKTPVQAMMAHGQPPPGVGGRIATMASAPPPGLPRPTKRDARMTFALPAAVTLVGFVLYVVLVALGSSLAVLALLLLLGGAIWSAVLAVQMASELKSVTRNEGFAAWPIFVPFYNLYWAWVVVPAEVARAKQMTGVREPVRPLVRYVLLWHFALASDINDLVRPGSSPSSSG